LLNGLKNAGDFGHINKISKAGPKPMKKSPNSPADARLHEGGCKALSHKARL
jgi:hypothetical protein